MANIDRKALLEEYIFLSGLLKKHDAASKDAKIRLSLVPQNCAKSIPVPQKLVKEHSSPPQYKLAKNTNQSLPHFSKKYSFHKSNHLSTTNSNKRTVLYNQFKSEIKSDKNNLTKEQLIKDIQTFTQLLKKKTSENKLLNPDQKRKNEVQNKLLSFKCQSGNQNLTTYNKYKSVKQDTSSKTKSVNSIHTKVVSGNVSLYSKNNVKQSRCYSKINPCKNTSSFTNSNNINQNKYYYKKVDSTKVNSKLIDTPLNNSEKKEPKEISEKKQALENTHIRKVIYSDLKSVKKSPCNSSVLPLTSVSPVKSSLLKSNTIKDSFSPCDKLFKKSIAAKVKPPNVRTPRIIKPTKELKLKISSTRFTKINKHMTTSSKAIALKNAYTPKLNKKNNTNVNTKYAVINKTRAACLNKKSLLLNNVKCDKTSPVVLDESESFFQELDDTAIDKWEKDLLAQSTALTTTPTPRKTTSNSNEINNPFPAKENFKLSTRKMSLKKSKKRISKYKIVNSSSQNYFARKQTLVKPGIKKINRSKYSLINKNIQPQRISTPARLGKSILVKRLFKSKNTIINKNASPTNYSAKMIKTKYLTLTKRKFPSWQRQAMYAKVPSQHQKLKGYYLRPIHNRYQKAAFSRCLKKTRKFSNYNCPSSRSRFIMNSSNSKLKKKLKNGYICSPVLFVRGVRYSQNSSGKTLKKLPTKGQTSKTIKRIVIGGKATMRMPDNLLKAPGTPSNFASRALHRSINRILIASTKKNLTKVNTYCMFYNRFGRCNKGVKCTYIHDPSKIAVCTRFLRGTCKVDGCPFSHEIAPGKMAICSFFLLGACEKENCPYRHEKLLPDAELCKAFVQGYCPSGKECKKAHILICPKYIQGECDKGSSCAFPHPPKKVKKTVQKEEEDEGKKPDDVLLEKVARYFQQMEDTSACENKSKEITVANRCVPKYRKPLEEQPAFIPLFDNSLSSGS